MDTTFIYVLKEPDTGEIRYVGKSNNPYKRLISHLRRDDPNHRVCWIKGLLQLQKHPKMEIIDEVPIEHWQQWEVAYIEFFKEQGCDLVNGTLGGDGSLGVKPSSETRLKMSLAHSKIEKTPEWKEKVRLSHIGKKRSSETCRKISEAKQYTSLETREKMRLAKLGIKRTESAKLNQSKALLKKGKEKLDYVLSLQKEGKSIQEIAHVLGRHKTAVYAFLRRRKLCP